MNIFLCGLDKKMFPSNLLLSIILYQWDVNKIKAFCFIYVSVNVRDCKYGYLRTQIELFTCKTNLKKRRSLLLSSMLLKPGQNKKSQKNFQLPRFLNTFLQLAAEKKYSKNCAAGNFFSPSYFVTALEHKRKVMAGTCVPILSCPSW